MRELVDELGTKAKQLREDSQAADKSVLKVVPLADVRVLCLPARDEADEITGMMLGQLLEAKGVPVVLVSSSIPLRRDAPAGVGGAAWRRVRFSSSTVGSNAREIPLQAAATQVSHPENRGRAVADKRQHEEGRNTATGNWNRSVRDDIG